MNRTLKRVLGLTGSVVLGFAGAIAFASSAQAHHTVATPDTKCLDDGGWQVEWSVTDWNWKDYPQFDDLGAGEITKITPSVDVPLSDGFAVGDKLPYPGEEAPLTATQQFTSDVESATLLVEAEWPNDVVDDNSNQLKTALKPADGCEKEEPKPTLTTASDCFGITVTVGNENPEALTEFVLTPSDGGDPATYTPAVGDPVSHFFFVEFIDEGLTVTVTADGEDAGVFEWEGLEFCPEFVPTESCEGVQLELAVPADGTETTFTFTPSEGEPTTVTVMPGESATVDFPFEGDELTVEYEFTDGKFLETNSFSWAKAEDCDEETPPADEQLPKTGSSMTIMISAAAALLAAAAVLFFIARRRRAAANW